MQEGCIIACLARSAYNALSVVLCLDPGTLTGGR